MKVLFLLPRLSDGGAERVVSNISLSLGKHNVYHDILVWEDEIVYPHSANNIIRIGDTNRHSKLYDLMNYRKRINAIKKVKKEGNYDLVISGLVIPNLFNIATRKYPGKVILTEHTFLTDALKAQGIYGKVSGKKMKNKFKYADKIVAVSHGIKNDLVDNFNVPANIVDVIYNSVKKVNEFKAVPEFNKSDFNIITVGRLSKAKGQWHQIHMMKDLVVKYPNAKLHILGGGPLLEPLQALTNKLNLSKNIIFHGFKEDVASYIKTADLMLVSSIYEGFGNVLIEAMALGTPVVSTACKVGPLEIVTEETKEVDFKGEMTKVAKNGLLVPPFSYSYDIEKISSADKHIQQCLIKAITEVIENDTLRSELIQHGYKRAEDFELDKINQQWLDLINSYKK